QVAGFALNNQPVPFHQTDGKGPAGPPIDTIASAAPHRSREAARSTGQSCWNPLVRSASAGAVAQRTLYGSAPFGFLAEFHDGNVFLQALLQQSAGSGLTGWHHLTRHQRPGS